MFGELGSGGDLAMDIDFFEKVCAAFSESIKASQPDSLLDFIGVDISHACSHAFNQFWTLNAIGSMVAPSRTYPSDFAVGLYAHLGVEVIPFSSFI